MEDAKTCSECKTMHYSMREDTDLCRDCYEDFFKMAVDNLKQADEEENFELEDDEDFALGFEEAVITESNSGVIYLDPHSDNYYHNSFKFPKHFKIDPEMKMTTEEKLTLLDIVLSQMTFGDNLERFDEIKHLLKQI